MSHVPIFQALSAEDQAAVAELAVPTSVAKGEVIYRAGQAVSQLMVVHRGSIRVVRITPRGQERLIRVLGPGDFIGEGAFLTGERPDHWATAMTDSRMCVFRHEDLAGLVARHPGIGLVMLNTVSRRLSETERRLAASTSAEIDVRLADYLLDLPSQRSGDLVRLTLPLAKKDVASLLGTTPETLSRTLARMAKDGLIALHGARDIDLLDTDALVALVEGR
ncbi:Crp/Fnr family transcriptional regulator [Raineyella fluvialis]|uniref:Crp/Fnr family transcriptional regulator n=1 Tax=Raineyella fluvialis TaxID=2662261 RepID=UPI001E2F943D|nr:Crp/Fnr family transcriptional regulator [Raineyella fluvialis]